jgi:hypothetical protein
MLTEISISQAGKDSQPYNFVASKYSQIYLEWVSSRCTIKVEMVTHLLLDVIDPW